MENPYRPPQSIENAPLTRKEILKKVRRPAFLLVLFVLMAVPLQFLTAFRDDLGIVVADENGNRPSERFRLEYSNEEADRRGREMEKVAGVIWLIIELVMGGYVIYGAASMWSLSRRDRALVVSYLVMLPCFNVCCIVGIPLGLWTWHVLQNPEVRRAFEESKAEIPQKNST